MNGSTPRVLGDLTVTHGTITMDNGNGMMTYLELKNVTITGTRKYCFCSNSWGYYFTSLVLVTSAFTDNSTSALAHDSHG